MIKSRYALVVIGAGPAGMAAARVAADNGVEVAVFDQQPHPGGQIYRNVDNSPLTDTRLLGDDYANGREQVQAFRRAGLDYFPSTPVWYLDSNRQLGVIHEQVQRQLSADIVVIASGAQERPMPFPGWQLPGVMTAGAGQILLKSAAMVPRQAPVLLGSGPLLLLLAWQFLRAGVRVQALVETTPAQNRAQVLSRFPRAVLAGEYLWQGHRLIRSLRQAGVEWFKHATQLRAQGDRHIRRLCFHSSGKYRSIETELLLTHQGVMPALQIADAAGCECRWHQGQQCWQAQIDTWGESSVDGIFVAGDGAAIGGAHVAGHCGELAGLQIAHRLGLIDRAQRDRLARPIARSRARHLAVRPFLDAYYRLAVANPVALDETLLCRCEELNVAQLRAVIELGCSGPNQAKAFIRCGMGPCQGRYCASTVEQVFAQQRHCSVAEIGRYRSRPPLQPITLGQLARAQEDKS